MTEPAQPRSIRTLERLPTGITGFDAITGGGLPAHRSVVITGAPGTGKTTFGNQLAFLHAARGGQAIVATLLTEAHDVMLENLQSFDFFDPGVVGERLHFLSALTPLLEGGFDATISMLRHEVRESKATLLVIDGTAIAGDVAPATLDLQRFGQRLDAQAAFLGCTTVLLTNTSDTRLDSLWAHVNGVVVLTNRPVGSRSVRTLDIIKLRGVRYTTGEHEFAIQDEGVTVYPRLESLAGRHRRQRNADHGVGTGVAGLDTMLGGGLMPLSSTLVMGTPGSGKTILGLHYLIEGAQRGERGLLVSFHETADELRTTAERVGLDLREHIASGMIRVLWHPPLEIAVDEWAWHVLAAMEEHTPARVYIDALTDVVRIMTVPERTPMFVTALANELGYRGATSLIAAELDEYIGEDLSIPIPAASAAMDNCILLRHVEVRGQLRRLVAVPKVRQAVTDPAIREVEITDQGMTIALPIVDTTGLLTGRTAPVPPSTGEGRP